MDAKIANNVETNKNDKKTKDKVTRKLKLIIQIRKINRIQRWKVKEIPECNKQMRFVEKKELNIFITAVGKQCNRKII